jgi:SAM-dependent methyltransferase
MTDQPWQDPVDPAVHEKVANQDPWYVGSHFEWAERPSIRPIYEKRFRYFKDCIARARSRLGGKLRLLDAGCGDGYWLGRLQHLGNLELHGIDYNPLRIERARRAIQNATIDQRSLFDYQPAEPFDVVLLNQVIEHVQDDIGLLGKIRSILKPEGLMILGTTNEGSVLQRWANQRRGPSFQTDHVHFYTEPEIRGKLGGQRFAIESILREVFYPGSDRVYYSLTRHEWGFKLLELLTVLLPSQCSDYYFECRAVRC